MKPLISAGIGGLALLILAPATAQARVAVNLDIGIPLYVEPAEQYYAPPPPVYYGPGVIYRDRDWDEGHARWKREHHGDYENRKHHDQGRHRGHEHRDD